MTRSRPSFRQELRAGRMATVRRVVDAEGWPPPECFPVRECLLTILD